MKPQRLNALACCSLTALLLSACGEAQMASYLIDGSKHSLTLVRESSFLWSSERDLTFITTSHPACQRRHKLSPGKDSPFKADLYRSYDGAFILHQDQRWYVTETRNCQLQPFQTPPPEPGDLLGSFEVKDGDFKFVAAPEPAVPALTPAVTPAAAPLNPAPPAAPQPYEQPQQAATPPTYPQPAEQPAPPAPPGR